jgi:hypothetical protein
VTTGRALIVCPVAHERTRARSYGMLYIVEILSYFSWCKTGFVRWLLQERR